MYNGAFKGDNVAIFGKEINVFLNEVSVSNSVVKQGSPGFYIFANSNVNVNVNKAEFKSNESNKGTSGNITVRSYKNIDLSVSDSIFDNNFSERGGVGIYTNSGDSTNLTVDNTDFTNNETVRITYDESTGISTGLPSNGGAIYMMIDDEVSYLNIKDSIFENNYGGPGGAISIGTQDSYVQTMIDNSCFKNNSADYSAGAISYYYRKDSEVEGALTINNSEFTGNSVSGKDNGPSYYRGGDGGAITLNALSKYPNLLKTNNTKFEDNDAQIKNYWHYDKDSSEVIDTAYTKNIINTSFSKDTSSNNLKNRNNIFNGDDVHFDRTAYVVLDFSEKDYEDLKVNNYDTTKLIYFNAYVGTHFSKLVVPTADGYTFVGWKVKMAKCGSLMSTL